MLPAAARLRASVEIGDTVRRGCRGGSRTVVVHVRATDRVGVARAGFVVSKKVGNSVVRNRVTRRLRPLVRRQLAEIADGTDIVVRALPEAAAATSTDFDADLHRALRAALRRSAR